MTNLLLLENRIMGLATAKNLSKNKLLDNIGLGKSLFDNMKKGKIPSIDRISLIADYLGCSVDYLLGRTDEPSLSSNVIGGDVTGGTVVQGANRSSVVVHNGGERTLTDEETELLRLFNALGVKRRIKLLNLAFSLEEEIKSELSEQN